MAKSAIKKITDRARDLLENPDISIDLSAKYEIDTDFRELFVNHNHLFYYKNNDTIIVAEMFGEKEDFMYKLFGISGRTQESIDYWGEQLDNWRNTSAIWTNHPDGFFYPHFRHEQEEGEKSEKEKGKFIGVCLLWSILFGALMILTTSVSLSYFTGLGYFYCILWIGIADVVPIALTPFVIILLAKRMKNIRNIVPFI